MAIRDHFGQPSERAAAAQEALGEKRRIRNEAHSGSSANIVEEVQPVVDRIPVVDTEEDRWAVSTILTNRGGIQVSLSRVFVTYLTS
jgi:hypothetical protein